MKNLLLIFLAISILSISVNAQKPEYSDRWKETKRLDLKKKAVDYTDTFYIGKITKENLEIRYNGFKYTADIIQGKANFVFTVFDVVKNNKKEVILKDNDHQHIFSRELKDYSAAGAAEAKANMAVPDKPVAQINTELLNASWDAYKRENRQGPSSSLDFKKLIRTFAFSAEGNQITINKNYNNEEVFAPNFEGGTITSGDENIKRKLTVWKLDKEELIIEDEMGIIYYLKKF